MINVYTDGSCINNGKPNARAGIGIYFRHEDERNFSQEIFENPTNNVAELSAIIKSFSILKEDIKNNTEVNIYSDSQYSINSFTTWGEGWYKNGWKKRDKKEIKNLDLIKKGYLLFKKYNNVKLIHIKAHTNKLDVHSVGNENADKLANLAIGHSACPYNFNNVEKVDNYIFTFGKYKNKDIHHVKEHDIQYLKWCIKNLSNKNIVNILKQFV